MKECITLDILTINDVYKFTHDGNHGGFARISTLLEERRNALKDKENSYSVFTVNGDFLGGSKLAVSSKGQACISVLEALKTDMVVIGNHEFDFGPDRLSELISNSTFDWVCSNIYEKLDDGPKRLFRGVEPFHIMNLSYGENKCIKVGWFGLCTASSVYSSEPGETTVFENPVDTAKDMVRLLREENQCDCVIALTHLDVNQDIDIAEQVSGIDLILGGHDHQPYAQYYDTTLLFKCGQNGYWLGEVELKFFMESDEPRQFKIYPSWNMISTFAHLPDPTIVSLISTLAGSHDDDLGDAVENLLLLEDNFDTRTDMIRRKSANSTNLLADILHKALQADFGLINGGFIRGDKIYKAGYNLTDKDIKQEMPFPKKAMVLLMKECDIWLGLEQMLVKTPSAIGSFPHVSANCDLVFSSKSNPYEKVKSFSINGVETKRDSSNTWKVGLSEFMHWGGDGCTAFSKGELLFTSTEVIKVVVINYLRQCQQSISSSKIQLSDHARVTDIDS